MIFLIDDNSGNIIHSSESIALQRYSILWMAQVSYDQTYESDHANKEEGEANLNSSRATFPP